MFRCRCNSCMGYVVFFFFEFWNLNCFDFWILCYSSSIMIRILIVKNREYKLVDIISVVGNNVV